MQMNKDNLLNKTVTFTGERIAEELVFSNVTTGAGNDTERTTKLVCAYKMGSRSRYAFGGFYHIA